MTTKISTKEVKAREELGTSGSFVSSVFNGKRVYYQYYQSLDKYYFIVGKDAETQCSLPAAEILKFKHSEVR